MSVLTEHAPAKVNLTLRVLRRRPDGFHDLDSLVAFANTGDELTLEPGGPLALNVSGEGASGLDEACDNLILRAARGLAERIPGLVTGRFHLVKNLPVASGIGGGSSDAAAALRLLAHANDLDPGEPRVVETARALGSDVPVCLQAKARIMRGRGEVLGAPLALPPLPAVLVNPRVAVATPQVFAALGLAPGAAGPGVAESFPPAADRATLMVHLKNSANDLEDAARRLTPEIDAVRYMLAENSRPELIRMSGSGATVFAIYASGREAAAAAATVQAVAPGWWVRPVVLGGG
jgi:4-diphosphocytidyl-2-C-methyl-D-erythritol kinase